MTAPTPPFIQQLVHDVFDSIHRMGSADFEVVGGTSVASWVKLSGGGKAWVVRVDCTENLLRSTAGVLFQKKPSEVTWYLMTVTLAEVANMVGGNVKGLVGDFDKLSLPTTVSQLGERPTLKVAASFLTVAVPCQNGQVVVSLHEAMDVSAP